MRTWEAVVLAIFWAVFFWAILATATGSPFLWRY